MIHFPGCQCPACQREHYRPHPVPAPPPDLVSIMHKLHDIEALIINTEKRTMAGISDINTALDQLGDSLSTQLTAIQTEIQQLVDAGGGATAEQLQAIVDRVSNIKVAVDATITQLAADDPAPPSPGSAASVP
jgi:hypothetical protein